MINKLVDSIRKRIGASKDAKEKKKNFTKEVYFFVRVKGSLSLRRGRPEDTDWAVTRSIGEEVFGFCPVAYHVSLIGKNAKFTVHEIGSLFGENLFTLDKHGNLRPKVEAKRLIQFAGDSKYTVRVGAELPDSLMVNLWKLLANAANLTYSDILPAHSGWVFETKRGINFVCSKPGTPRFIDVIGTDRAIFYRAGKDIWKSPLETIELHLKIVTTPDNDWDGDFYTRVSGTWLARGATKTPEGKWCILKGRAHHMPEPILPNGKVLGKEYDGWTSRHNFKWNQPAGDSITITIQKVLREEEEILLTKRKLNIVALLMAKTNEATYTKLYERYRSRAEAIGQTMARFPQEWRLFIRELEQDEFAGIRQSQIIKLALGLGNWSDKNTIYSSILKRVRSLMVDGFWMPCVARLCVTRGEVWTSPKTAKKIMAEFANEQGYLRYPPSSYQSFCTYKVRGIEGYLDDLLVFNGLDALFQGMDGDDHELVSKAFSTFRGGEEVICARNAEKRDLNSLTFTELYSMGARSQQLLGLCFNAMCAALGSPNGHALARELGALLDILAQSIKKPYEWDLSPIIAAGYLKDISPVALIAQKKNIQENVEKAFNVKLPADLTAGEVPNVRFCGANKKLVLSALAAAKNEVSGGTYTNGRQRMDAVRNWHAKLYDWTVTRIEKDDESANAALQSYAALAVGIVNWRDSISSPVESKFAGKYLQIMEGDFLLAGFSFGTKITS